MAFFIQLDTQAAQKVGSSNRIDGDISTVATIKQAFYTHTQKGTQTLVLSLESETGEQGDFPIYFANSENERLSGYNLINAIIALTGVQGISQVQGTYLEQDWNAGRKVEKQGYIAPELIGKKVGIITTFDYYDGTDQQGNSVERYRVQIYSVYHAQTMQWARQVLNNEQAKAGQTDQMLEQAKKVSVRSREKLQGSQNQAYAPQGYQQPPQQGYAPQQGYQQPQQGYAVQPSPMTSMQRQPSNGYAQPQQGYAVTPTVADQDMPF